MSSRLRLLSAVSVSTICLVALTGCGVGTLADPSGPLPSAATISSKGAQNQVANTP